MIQGELFDARCDRHIDDVLGRAMPPSNLFAILGGGVLRIVDDQIGPLEEVRVTGILNMDQVGEIAGPGRFLRIGLMTRMGLVV